MTSRAENAVWTARTPIDVETAVPMAAAIGAGLCLVMAVVAAVAGPLVAGLALAGAAVVLFVVVSPMGGICLAIATIPLGASGLAVGSSAGLSMSEGLFALASGVAVVRVLVTPARLAVAPPHVAFGTFLIVASLGVLFAEDKLVIAKTVFFWGVMLVASLMVARASRRELTGVLASIAVAGGLIGLLAIVHAGDLEVRGGGGIVTNRAETAFGQPNIVAFFLVLAIPVALVMGLRSPRRLRIPMLALGTLAIGGLALTFSRSGLVAAMLSLMVLGCWRPFRAPFIGFVIAAVLAIAVLPAGAGSGLVGQRLSTITHAQQLQENPRQSVWRLAPEVIADNALLGVGLSNFAHASASSGVITSFQLDRSDPEPFPHAHNLVLNVAAETGLLGLAAFLAFLLATGRTALLAWRRSNAADTPFVVGITAALAGFFVMGIADYQFTAPHAVIGTLLVEIGCLAAYLRMASVDKPSFARVRTTRGY